MKFKIVPIFKPELPAETMELKLYEGGQVYSLFMGSTEECTSFARQYYRKNK